MKIFVIRPVRNVDENFTEGIATQIEQWEQDGHEVYDPAQDTNQRDSTGLKICQDNLAAIRAADEVRFIWDGQSQGCLFDLGMAFALNKSIRPVIGYVPAQTNGKSFQNVVFAIEAAEESDD